MTTTSEVTYAGALRESREWVVAEFGDDSAPYTLAFINWYSWNAREYTIASAWEAYLGEALTTLVLRPREGEMSSAELRSRAVHPSNGEGRTIAREKEPNSVPSKIAVWA